MVTGFSNYDHVLSINFDEAFYDVVFFKLLHLFGVDEEIVEYIKSLDNGKNLIALSDKSGTFMDGVRQFREIRDGHPQFMEELSKKFGDERSIAAFNTVQCLEHYLAYMYIKLVHLQVLE
jgi:glutaredoxin-related protein